MKRAVFSVTRNPKRKPLFVYPQLGIASVNEVRDLEDWNPIDGGDDHHIQLNMQSLPGGAPLGSQAAALIRLGEA